MSQAKCWIQRNWKRFLKDVFMLTIPPLIFVCIAMLYGVVVVLAKETIMKALIEAEATVLGFFGLIIVYILTSLDEKEDRYEQQLFDLTEKGKKHEEVPEELKHLTSMSKGDMLGKALRHVHERRKTAIRYGSTIGIYLVSSLLLSILTLGIPNVVTAGFLSMFAVYLFLVSVASIFLMFRDMAKRPWRENLSNVNT